MESCDSGSTVESMGFGSTWPTRWPRHPAYPIWISTQTGEPLVNVLAGTPYMNQPHVHDILRRWRKVADSYAEANGGTRVFVSEAWVTPAAELARYVRPDELHTTFNFDALMCEDRGIPAQRHQPDPGFYRCGRGATTGCSRTTTRPGWSPATVDPSPGSGSTVTGSTRNRSRGSAWCRRATPMSPSAGSGPERRCCSNWLCRAVRTSIKVTSWAWRRSRTCPRTCYRTRSGSGPATPYVGGTAAECRFRGRVRSRRSDSGCGAPPWLPQPAHWADLTVAAQDAHPASMLNLYRAALAERRRNPALGDGTDLGRRRAGRGAVVQPRARLPVRGQLRARAVRDSRRCRGPGLVRPLRSPFGGDGRGGLVARLGCGAPSPDRMARSPGSSAVDAGDPVSRVRLG